MLLPAASWPSTAVTVTRVSRIRGKPVIRAGSMVIRSYAMFTEYAAGPGRPGLDFRCHQKQSTDGNDSHARAGRCPTQLDRPDQAERATMLMVANHACAPPRARTFSTTALGWMLATAAVTMTVHFVQLTVARRIDPSTVPGFDRLFGWHWPSLTWGAEITAWDLFLGLSLLCAAPVFAGRRYAMVRRGLLVSGSLCLAGLVGPALNAMAWREFGIFGYAVVLPLTCLALSRAFASASNDRFGASHVGGGRGDEDRRGVRQAG